MTSPAAPAKFALRVNGTLEQATPLLERFAQLGFEIAAAETARNEQIAKTNAVADAIIAPLTQERDRLRASIEPWWRRTGFGLLPAKKATMNAVLDDVDGRLRVSVLHNDLAAPIGDLFTGDVLGAFTWQQTLPLNDSVSVIRGGYSDPGSISLYQTADYPEVTIASRDGIERSQTVNYPLVQSASQAQRLSKQRLQRMLYGGTFTAVFQSTAWKFQKGDVIRLTFAPLGWNRKLFRIADMATQVDGKVPMMLREKHPAIYAWDASDAAPVTGAEPTRYDPALWPLLQGITEAGTTADWDKVADPNNTKPQDNATVGAPSGTEVGGRPVDDVIAAIDAAKTRQDEFESETLPAIDQAVSDAVKRVDDAAKSITDFDQRVTTVESSSVNGGNLLSNTDWAVGPAGWVFTPEDGSTGYLGSYGPETYWPVGMLPLQIYSPNGSGNRAGHWRQTVRGI
ncbi:phage tail protein [Sphingomonas phyllosphaerae]|uniref:phage tail protein n=1 Tax=Sphingomonas phyllosphaerae TaxID=257003 RepID=UPI000411FD35|nr:phage tail protein [Sphingomonas phyllosphaerae]